MRELDREGVVDASAAFKTAQDMIVVVVRCVRLKEPIPLVRPVDTAIPSEPTWQRQAAERSGSQGAKR